MASRGKEFEKRLKSALCEVPNSYTLRLIDSFGFTENPSDRFTRHKPLALAMGYGAVTINQHIEKSVCRA